MLDLVLPRECGGCGAPATAWCAACAAALDTAARDPAVISPRVDPGVAVFSLGRYAGARRSAIVAVKERGRADLVAPLARPLALGIGRLIRWGVLGPAPTVVPAPTRRAAARRRGGDPVARIAAAATAGCPSIGVRAVLRTAGTGRDSVGLGPAARQRNLAGRVRLCGPAGAGELLLVDDVVTTGATAAAAVAALHAAGATVSAVLALSHA